MLTICRWSSARPVKQSNNQREIKMEKAKIACVVIGAMGRMGQRLCQLSAASDSVELAGGTESPGSGFIGKTLKELMGLGDGRWQLVQRLEDIAGPFDAVIDFTFPAVSMDTARFCARSGKAAVIGSTGFTPAQQAELQALSASFPCVCAPNMSMGVNTLFKIAADVARILHEGFDVEVVEMHHRHKKDAPSGTAMRLAEILARSYGWSLDRAGVYERKGITGERRCDEIGIQTLRGGDVVGEHTVLFAGTGERIELIHRAQSRDCFAQGALHAAKWLMERPAGLFDMQDVLGFRDAAA
jgi:4-hydroxy-tetrahydrodipicolinate reductase